MMPNTDEVPQMAGKDFRRLNTLVLAFIALIGVVFVLYQLYDVLLPLVLAAFLSVLFKPLMRVLRQRGLPLSVCILIVLICSAAIFALITLIVTTGVQNMVEEGPRYQASLNKLFQSTTTFIESTMRRFTRGAPVGRWTDSLQLSSITGFLASSAESVLNLALNLVLTILFLVFLLLGSEDFATKITRAFSTEGSARVSQILAQINTDIRRYLVTKTLINAIVAAVTVVTMLLFDVDFALFTGVLTFFLNYIPNFGALISTVFPGVVSLLQYQSFGLTTVFVLVLAVEHNIIGNFLEPKMMGTNLNLSPLVVLLSLIFWGYVWGVWGMVLAIPVVSIIKIVCENVAPLRPIAILISTPPEKAKEKVNRKLPV